ncbi:hypothetical protein PEX1_035380 [Penicillium expansum]|uniref:Uncharacterized protein n=1 Tax=Penicillium expansum TaxID=27334 RepID=A0A0A2IG22_PENEN|nr:hypothetical protein PEX2_094890 [Penicillium expansum]KGO41408.1 hypothetical protein PEXP_104840 [Penicillium expansum]KGO51023.1 hypothetical protein PEX2_094890 [Penicillium expansum]KGO67268.1 hypothetical protein PEX1_035380 [Penicillium expansum]
MDCHLAGHLSDYPPKAIGSDKSAGTLTGPRLAGESNQIIREIIRFHTIRNVSRNHEPERHPTAPRHVAISTQQRGRSSA